MEIFYYYCNAVTQKPWKSLKEGHLFKKFNFHII